MSLQLVNTIALGVIAIFTIGSIRVSYLHARSKQISRDEWLREWISGFSTEMAGALLTAVLFGLIVGAAQQNQNEQDLKQELVLRLGSRVNDIAIQAAEELDRRGWLQDGSLEQIDLHRANLQGAYLGGANLQEVDLGGANLQKTNLFESNLQEADLNGANLQDAELSASNLQEADLGGANLQGTDLGDTNLLGADLNGANLQGVNLHIANLNGANLKGANLINADLSLAILTGAILPDGTDWTPETDMARFTNPMHPNFWRSESPSSPTYRPAPTLTP